MSKLILILNLIFVSALAHSKQLTTNKKSVKQERNVATNISKNDIYKILKVLKNSGINPNSLATNYIGKNDCGFSVVKEDLLSVNLTDKDVLTFKGKIMCSPVPTQSPAVGVIEFKGTIKSGFNGFLDKDTLTEMSFQGYLESSD